jgi:hypothetical protein
VLVAELIRGAVLVAVVLPESKALVVMVLRGPAARLVVVVAAAVALAELAVLLALRMATLAVLVEITRQALAVVPVEIVPQVIPARSAVAVVALVRGLLPTLLVVMAVLVLPITHRPLEA